MAEISKIKTRIRLFNIEDGEYETIQIYDSYVWVPRSTVVKHKDIHYTVEEYSLDTSKNFLDITVIKK